MPERSEKRKNDMSESPRCTYIAEKPGADKMKLNPET